MEIRKWLFPTIFSCKQVLFKSSNLNNHSPPQKINMSPEKGPFQKEIYLPAIIFQGICESSWINAWQPIKAPFGRICFTFSKHPTSKSKGFFLERLVQFNTLNKLVHWLPHFQTAGDRTVVGLRRWSWYQHGGVAPRKWWHGATRNDLLFSQCPFTLVKERWNWLPNETSQTP